MIELGGNIKLDGFESIEPAQLIVVKKIVGNVVKEISEKIEFSEFLLTLKDTTISINVTAKDKEINKKDSGDNLFITLDKVLAKVKSTL